MLLAFAYPFKMGRLDAYSFVKNKLQSLADLEELGCKQIAAETCIAVYLTPRSVRDGTTIIGPFCPLIRRYAAGFGFGTER